MMQKRVRGLMVAVTLILVGIISGCNPDDEIQPLPTSTPCVVDCDQDGSTVVEGDCNDTDSNTHPNADEICDQTDNDCDGLIDEDLDYSIFFLDGDGDDHGRSDAAISACSMPSGYAEAADDCDDEHPGIYPGADEICDQADNDCDGKVDEDAATAASYADTDGDGYGDPDSAIQACAQPDGYVSDSTDCDDTIASSYPGAKEVCDGMDNDCNGTIDENLSLRVFFEDSDGDGYGSPEKTTYACTAPQGYAADNTDCDDTNDNIHPTAPEFCDEVDNDCDGQVDEDVVELFWYVDADGDGYGTGTPVQNCAPTDGYTSNSGDCNDDDAAIHPGATELCDGVDNDCDGQIDGTLYYLDVDEDGYGDSEAETVCRPTDGYVAAGGDCDDENEAVRPGAGEVCNGTDDDCDNQVDEGALKTSYEDADSDGYGNPEESTISCTAPDGYVANGGDCNDTDATVNPSVAEICGNEVDDDCNGEAADDTQTYYRDADEDGYGDSSKTTQACVAPDGYVTNNTDCDDNNAAIHPGVYETCNGLDDDCDGVVDEFLFTTYYLDTDGDEWGTSTSTTQACSPPAGYTFYNGDCDDTNPAVHPGATEVCGDGIDNDCSGGDSTGSSRTYYKDVDGDGYGDPTSATTACSAPTGYVTNYTDCNDNNAAIHPNAIETCNGKDDDCDGQVDEGMTFRAYYRDADGDGYGNPNVTTGSTCSGQPAGYVTNYTDCNDTNAAVHPGVYETCNETDDDCDGSVDEGLTFRSYYRDADNDGYGNPKTTTGSVCSGQPAGYVTNNTDCDDTDAAIHPGVYETCNGKDDDCDGVVDETLTFGTYYQDADSDNYGNSTVTTGLTCNKPAGYVTSSTDCNDKDASIHPGVSETCDGVDEDCDGQVDEGMTFRAYYRDADGDGYGDPTKPSAATCLQPAGYVTNYTDCDDANAAVHPYATEVKNGVDDDCDGKIDE